jgi:hypothetical protein
MDRADGPHPVPGLDKARLLTAVPDNYPDLVEFEGVEILAAEVRREKDSGWTRVSEETAVPTLIKATLYTAEPLLKLDIRIQVDWAGRGTVRELTVLTDGPQTGVSISLLRRIPVDTLMRFAMTQASVPAKLRPDIGPGAFQVPGDAADSAWVSGGPLEPGRGKNTPTDRIARVAEIYKDALANGSRSPAEVVTSVMGYSSATTSRDLKEARKRGLLPPAGTKGGRTPTPSAITGTGRVTRMTAEDFNRAAEEIGVQGKGIKGKRFSELTPDEFEEIVRNAGVGAKHPGAPTDGQEDFLDEQRRVGHQVAENRRPNDDSGPL